MISFRTFRLFEEASMPAEFDIHYRLYISRMEWAGGSEGSRCAEERHEDSY
jgi:hypothetical protein